MSLFTCETCGLEFCSNGTRTRKTCSLRCRGIAKSRRTTPGLIEDYFQDIDTKDKSYWFGFLLADGCIHDDKGQLALSLTLSLKDSGQLIRFADAIGVDRSRVKKYSSTVKIVVSNRLFCERLVSKGCVPRKTKCIRFPDITGLELEQAFVLGYFDGDGSIGSTNLMNWSPTISCGSKEFLNEINRRFWLRKKVCFTRDKVTPLVKYPGSRYTLSIGRAFYRELLANYPNSMPRKRIGDSL